ncbi:CPBP family intramembrane metalloprotease [Candidatus Saccharibacteria bacterium]|nr:CPBP family intramembrane metalloprotease [Candidatus Saccharibacteria bacterium]
MAKWVAPFAFLAVPSAFIIAQLIGALTTAQVGILRGIPPKQIETWLQNNLLAQFLFMMLSEALIVLAIFGLLRFLHWTWRTIGLSKPMFKHILYGVAAVIPYYILYLLIVALVSALVPSLDVNQKQEIGFDNATTRVALLLTFVSLVLIPPFVEEIAMRGFMYTGLKTWLPVVPAALLVSVIFGMAHLAEGGEAGPLWIGAIDTFTLSLVLVFLREKTGNLWAGITLHALKNFVAFMLVFVLHAS